MTQEIPQPADFAIIIEDMVKRGGTVVKRGTLCNRLQYKEAIVKYAEDNDINIEDIPDLVNNRLKAKLRQEAEELHLLPKTSRLPV